MQNSRRQLIPRIFSLACVAQASLGAMAAQGSEQSSRTRNGAADSESDDGIKQEVAVFAGRRFSFRAALDPVRRAAPDVPLIVALHGGTYTSRYFDIPGYSLLRRARASGLPIIAFDRPGYEQTPLLEPGDASHAVNAAILDAAIAQLWEQHGEGRAGIALIGHSIGGAIALRIAARRPQWPLLGVAVSGVGLKNAPNRPGVTAELQQTPPTLAQNRARIKDASMFGPEGTFEISAPDASRVADSTTPQQESIDIRSTWAREAVSVLANIAVPVHYRQAAQDKLWLVNPEEVRQFATACAAAPRVDAEIIEHSGHCIDFHRIGASFQLQQLAFALRTAFEREFSR